MAEPKPTRVLIYDIPLRPDFIAQIVVPRDLTTLEAKRMRDFLAALAVPESQTGEEEETPGGGEPTPGGAGAPTTVAPCARQL